MLCGGSSVIKNNYFFMTHILRQFLETALECPSGTQIGANFLYENVVVFVCVYFNFKFGLILDCSFLPRLTLHFCVHSFPRLTPCAHAHPSGVEACHHVRGRDSHGRGSVQRRGPIHFRGSV